MQELKDDFSRHQVARCFYLEYIEEQQETADNHSNNRQSFHSVLGPVLSNLHSLLYHMTQTLKWKKDSSFLKSWNSTAFSVMVVNNLNSIVFLVNTCKLMQHTLRKVYLAINIIFAFEHFLHLNKKPWEQPMYVAWGGKLTSNEGKRCFNCAPVGRQKREVLKGPHQQKAREEPKSFSWNHQSTRNCKYCVLGGCSSIAVSTLECRLRSIFRELVSLLLSLSALLWVTSL